MNTRRFPHRLFVVLLALLPAFAVPAQDTNAIAGWLEYEALRRDIDRLPIAAGEDFIERHRGQAVAEAFRAIWLPAMSRREEWRAFNASWSPAIKSTSLRCMSLNARAKAGGADAQWVADAQAMWRSTGESLPGACDEPFELLAEKGGLTPVLRWERFDKAVAEWNVGVMRTAAEGLPDAERKLADRYADFMTRPGDDALSWPKTGRSRLVASHGLAKLGRSNPDAAEARLPRFAQALDFTEADRGRVLYQVALWTVASYDPGSQRRLAAVPASSYDERLHEWQVREALSRSDWPVALAAIRAMGDEQRSDSRWTYFEGRLLALTGDEAGARAAWQRAALIPEFHGFLAADRLGEPYALCPWLLQTDPATKAAVAADPAMVRAMQLFRMDRKDWALLEWNDALDGFDDAQRRIAVDVAQDNGWFDRAVFALGRTPDERRLYALRFPLHHDATIRREAARQDLDPAWVAAEIRAESVFDPKARSAANARGLMQVVPATGAAEARRLGLPWRGADSLYDPDTNIALGTAYLRKVLDRYGGKPYFAIAGYNAGPTPLQRWQSERPGMDADFWIETISYKETREYVARVLAFSTIYDWRLDGTAVPLTARMEGRHTGARKSFVCPLVQP
ncbi:MAG: lytic transglycosylase domain-containing protein [Pseudomonadota bacterium]|nr:lytic transglycosylase domain-containing protein [Pseudomonadota bacterium]